MTLASFAIPLNLDILQNFLYQHICVILSLTKDNHKYKTKLLISRIYLHYLYFTTVLHANILNVLLYLWTITIVHVCAHKKGEPEHHKPEHHPKLNAMPFGV